MSSFIALPRLRETTMRFSRASPSTSTPGDAATDATNATPGGEKREGWGVKREGAEQKLLLQHKNGRKRRQLLRHQKPNAFRSAQ